MAEPSPGNGLSQKRGFTVSQTGFLFRLSPLRLGIEGVGERMLASGRKVELKKEET